MVESLIFFEENGKKETRANYKADLEEVRKSDDNCPIVLDKMTFNVFYHCMSTKKSEKYGRYISTTSYGGVRSSLTHLYRMSGKTMHGEF